jgi:hypothetical protein
VHASLHDAVRVGDYGQQGGVHSKVKFLASGLHGEDDFSL